MTGGGVYDTRHAPLYTHTVRALRGASSAYDIPTQARRSRLVVLNILREFQLKFIWW